MSYSCNSCKGVHDIGEICGTPIHPETNIVDGFEKFLESKYSQTYKSYQDWLTGLEPSDYIKFANEYAETLKVHY